MVYSKMYGVSDGDKSVKMDHFFGCLEPPKIDEKFGQEAWDEWTRCGYVKGLLCNRWEVHPTGKLRKYKSKKKVNGRKDTGGYPTLDWVCRNTYNPSYRRWRKLSLHRIALETYCPKPHPNLECDHRDGTRDNYGIKNLRWVSHALNVSFQEHRGWSMEVRGGRNRYRTRFRNKYYGSFNTAIQARDQYLYVLRCWQREERERLILMVMQHNDWTRIQAISALNWDTRDDVDFLREL